MKEFKGKTAVIPGGASGLGLGIANACAAEGMNVVIADLRQSVLDQAVEIFNKNNWPVLGIELDTSKLDLYEKAVADAEARFGNITPARKQRRNKPDAAAAPRGHFQGYRIGIKCKPLGRYQRYKTHCAPYAVSTVRNPIL
jgi:NAD(P)-dependent dehydrogenase (short-subunit alcohol dehydrogenase family)